MLTPPEPACRSTLPTANPTGVVSRLVSFTVTHSPATTCMTRGTGALRRALIDATSALGTYAVRPPFVRPERSIALRSNWRRGASVGHGFPGEDVGGGAAPVGV